MTEAKFAEEGGQIKVGGAVVETGLEDLLEGEGEGGSFWKLRSIERFLEISALKQLLSGLWGLDWMG